MADDTKYLPKEYIYKSLGLSARFEYDECPEFVYIQNMNALERQENSLSSRYGYQIINRDPVGVGDNNHFFLTPITSIAKMNFQGNPQRYVGLQDGTLWQRNSNVQGAFTQIYSGLSGNPFETAISSCYETALPFLFIYDQAQSIKVAAGSSTAELTGIDPPDYTANALPYSPLLTLIDNFAAGNSYAASGFSGGWAWESIVNIGAGSGQLITDFPQFSENGIPLSGGSVSVTQSTVGGIGQETYISGFPSVPIAPGQNLTLTLTIEGTAVVTGFGAGSVAESQVSFFYSIDGGIAFQSFYISAFTEYTSDGTYTYVDQTIRLSIAGLTNLNELWLEAAAFANIFYAPGLSVTTTATISNVEAGLQDAGIFGEVCNGILSVLNTDSVTSVPIVSITGSGLVGDAYTTLTIVAGAPHGASTGQNISVYGASNDLADGFYPATVLSSNTLTVPFLSPVGYPVAISATGGNLQYVSASNIGPNTCVITNEYSTPYPTQFAAWGFYQQVPLSVSSFPIGAWSGNVAANSTATVGVTADFNLSLNNQVTDSDLIVLTLQIGSPQNIANIRLQFDVNGSGYTSSYYYANISPSYYQGNIANLQSAYQTTQNQILADALGLLTGQPESSTTAQLQPSNFSTGESSWVAVLIPRGNFLPVGSAGQSGLDWTNITGWQVVINTATTGSSTVAMNGLYLQWGYGPSSFAGVGYDYRHTYYNANTGTESSPNGEMEFNQQYGYLSSLSAPFYLRQAAQVQGYYSVDPQVTHYRVYRRGGIYANNWLLIDQIPNITAGGQFLYKDVVPDASLAQAQPLVLDNDPPVTSSLVTPILTTLSAATSGPGNSIYSTYAPQLITVTDATAVFVQNQIVLIGNAYNLEEVLIVNGGTGQFTAIVRLQHNAGEQVQVNASPRTACSLCAIANLPGGATQVVVAGDPRKRGRVYYAKPNQPENFGPENYVDSPSPDDPVMALINWRGTMLVPTLKTWYIFVGGANPYLQPTGAAHGLVASQGWTLAEGEVWFRAADGLRAFTGADGKYMTLPVEWIFRSNPNCLPPQVSASNAYLDVMAFYNNCVFNSFISASSSGQRYRIVFDREYNRFRQDDIGATAMLWEKDTNLLLCGVPVRGEYALVADQQYNQDYDDGGWTGFFLKVLEKVPIELDIQTPYRDLGKPHFPKQWNVLETDVDTQGQTLQTTLWFDSGEAAEIVLPTVSSTSRQKIQQQINAGDGNQSYSMSIQQQISVTVAPTFYQENIYAALLADYRSSFDSYWQKASMDELKLWKEGYFDYTATEAVVFSLYADGNLVNPYYTFTLPAASQRSVVRELFAAYKCRLWRMIGVSGGTFQLWAPVQVDSKPLLEGSGYQRVTYGVYE